LNASWDSWQSSHLRIDLPALASEIRRTARRAKSGSSVLGFFYHALLPCLKAPPYSIGLVFDHEASRYSPLQRFLFLVRNKGA